MEKPNKIIVSSLEQFLSAIQSFDEGCCAPFRVAFRGVCEQDNSKKHLMPSLQIRANGVLPPFEKEMVLEMKRLRPNEFNGLSDLELIGKLQHFKLPTRLLDFSFSPFVALWFAINNKSIKNGTSKVYCTYVRPQENVASLIAKTCQSLSYYDYYSKRINTSNNDDHYSYYIEDVLFPDETNDALKESLLRGFLTNIFDHKKQNSQLIFTYPRFNDRREQNQQSIFAIFFNKLLDTSEDDIVLDDNKTEVKKVLQNAKLLKRFVFKPEIYNPLESCLNFNSTLPSNFCEITINKKNIKGLRKELELLGINETFLFPESLEATVNDVVKYTINNMVKKKKI